MKTIARAPGDGVAETTAKRAGRDHGRAAAGEAGDAVNPRGLNGLGEGHRRQDGGESAGQHRRARPSSPVNRMLTPVNQVP